MSVKQTRGMLDSLIQTTPEVIKNIEEFEKKGLFSEHVDPINPDMILPVGDNFPYLKKPLRLRIKYFFIYNFIVKIFEPRELKRMGYKVVGRENLKGIKRAIVTSNHINKLDCTLNRHALKGHKLYITAADFNNMKGLLGDIMRASRMMPLGNTMAGMKNFDNAVNTLLKKNNYVLFYPERSEWWCYKKPRPMMNGAFHFAVKNNVPIIPNFITFKENGTAKIKYFKYPKMIDEKTNNNYKFELSEDVLEIMPYGVAADLLKSDVSAQYGQVYANAYQEALNLLDLKTTGGTMEIKGGINV